MGRQSKEEFIWIDPHTKLEWQMNAPEEKFTWPDANEYAKRSEYGGFADWRLPTVNELETLLDRGVCNPALRQEVPFRSCDYYWSSESYASDNKFAWGVGFYGGGVNYYIKGDTVHVRLIRDGANTADKE